MSAVTTASPATGDRSRLLEDVADIVGPSHVLVDPSLTAGFERDWTGRFASRALAVVRPASTEEVAAVVARCNRDSVGIVPQGGNTGLVGGGVPRSGEIILSLKRLCAPPEVDATSAELIAEAGVTLSEVHRAAAAAGLDFGVDFTARDGATVGGMIATNAGGPRVLRYGTMRAQLLGIEAVLADGSVIRRMTGLRKDNTGYDLASLLAGSEGTLGIVTRGRLRLVPRAARRLVAIIGVADIAAATRLVAELQRRDLWLNAAEVIFEEGLDLVVAHTGEARPFPTRHRAYLLLELASNADPAAELAEALEGRDEVRDVAVSEDGVGQARLWRLREGHPEAIATLGIAHKLDIAVPTSQLASFERDVRVAVSSLAPAAEIFIWGHVGDGNLHVNIVGLAPDDDTVDDAVLRLAIKMGGSTSAEHGIGTAKTRWLPLDRAPADLAAMRAIKHALDPRNILNPGVLFGAAPTPGAASADGR